MITHKKIGLFVSLLGLAVVFFAILLFLLLMRDSDINFLFGTLIFTGVTLIWLGLPISFICKSKTLLLRNYRILRTAGLLLVFFVSPLLFLGFDTKDTYAGTMLIGVVLWLVGFTGVQIQKEKPDTPKTDRFVQVSYAGVKKSMYNCYLCKKQLSQIKNVCRIKDCIMDHYLCEDCSREWIVHFKELMNNYLFGSGDSVKEMFKIPLVTKNFDCYTFVGELIFTSKGICFINTGYFKHIYLEQLIYVLNFFPAVLIGAAIIHYFHLSYKTTSMPIVAIIVMSLYQIENSLQHKKFQKKKDRALAEKEDILRFCKDFPSKISAARDVYILKKDEISNIIGNKNELTIEINDSVKPSVFQIESGVFEDYRSQIQSYLRPTVSPTLEALTKDKREPKSKMIYYNPQQPVVSREHKEEVDIQETALHGLTNCLNCLAKGVLPMSDGRCPNCKKML